MEVAPPRAWRPDTLPVSEFISSLKNYHRGPSTCSGIRLIDESRNCVTIGWNRPSDPGSSAIAVYRVEVLDENGEWKELGLSPRTELDVYGLKGTKTVRVTAANNHGWGEPVQETLKVPDTNFFLPHFSTELESQINVPPNERVTLSCKAEGHPEPELYWFKNGELLRHSGNELVLERLKEGGLYVCEARNPLGKASTHCYISIDAPGSHLPEKHRIRLLPPKGEYGPEIKYPLRDREADLGETVRLTLEVIGEPKPVVEWQRDGEPVKTENYHIFSEGDFHTLELIVKPETEGLYTARANGLGVAVTSALVHINPHSPCHFTLPLEPYARVGLGGNIRLIASLAPHLRLAKVIWSRDGVNLVQTRNCVMTHSAGGEVTLELGHVTKRAAGTYTCTVFGKGGMKAESKCEIDVVDSVSPSTPAPSTPIPYSKKPLFIMKPRNVEGLEGDTIILNCEVVGDPNPTITWLRDDLKISRYSRDQGEFRERRSGAECSLEIRQAKFTYTGKYTALASNIHGQATAVSTVQIFATGQGKTVKNSESGLVEAECDSLPLISRPLTDTTVTLGHTLYLECRVKGEPEPTVIWTKDGKLVKRGKNWFEAERAILEIPEPCLTDEGTYTCTVTNPLGTASTSAYVQVLDSLKNVSSDPPPSISPCVTSSSCLAGQATRWRPPDNRESLEPEELEEAGGGSLGEVALFFRNHSHHSAMCEEKASLITTALPDTLIAQEGQPLELSVSVSIGDVIWERNGLKLPNCQDFRQEVAGCTRSLVVKDIFLEDSGTVYSCRVVSGAREEISSTKVIVKECESSRDRAAKLVRAPQDLSALRGSRAVLQAVYTGIPQPSVVWYKGGRRLSGGGRITLTHSDGVSSVIIDPVTTDDSGKYVVTVTNRAATDTQFASLSVKGAPDPPAGRPSVTIAHSGGVTITWSSPHYDGGAMITGYTIELSEDNTLWTTVAHCCDRLSQTVKGLSPGTSYSFRVRSHNAHGPSDPGPPSHPFTVTHIDACEEEKWDKVEIAPGEGMEDKYTILEEIGKGRYGVVKRAVEVKNGETRAAKFVRTLKRQDRENVADEIDIMTSLRHPLLLRLFAAYSLPKDIVMILEYVSGGELFERVVDDDFTLTERDCILFMRQICEAVAYIHSQNIVHLDLKPENIMCTSRSCHVIKLIDFGLARRLRSDSQLRVLFGTPEFIPPEIINYEPVGFQSDMWSVGVIAYVLLSGLSPFMGENDAETFANITRAQYDYDDEAFDNISQDAKDFIAELLVKRKEDRLSAEECLRHRWISQADDTMSQVKISTDKLKKFIIRRKWQKTGNAIRALGRMATLSRRGAGATKPEPADFRNRAFSERSDSGFSDTCLSSHGPGLDSSIEEEQECEEYIKPKEIEEKISERVISNKSPILKVTQPEIPKLRQKKIPGSENIQKAFAFWNR
ncbi:myosin light chain kinase, smooth muscle isoform X2 [Halyomorpha halys]|uniref:myosin light chain kinase, smooth muscle isoform X2 n=1 Tax=Halyomorpha halys TaxID=286706 RepID=UPI0006D4F771|nr:myosin light chain kinase, smooth muscle-like isoform X2 [Halyomorpha halys]